MSWFSTLVEERLQGVWGVRLCCWPGETVDILDGRLRDDGCGAAFGKITSTSDAKMLQVLFVTRCDRLGMDTVCL
jgi:hypothetical protein